MSSIALPFDAFQKRVSQATQSVRRAQKITSRLGWLLFLFAIPKLRSLVAIQHRTNRSLATELNPSSSAELRAITKKLKLLHAHVEEVYDQLSGLGFADLWPYRSLIGSIGDQNAYLDSIIEGCQLSMDPDFCEVVRTSVEEMKAASEPLNCPTVR